MADGNSYSVNQGETLNVAAPGVLDNDTDADGDPLEAYVDTGPAHHQGTFKLKQDGSFDYRHNNGPETSDSFTYKAYDGNAFSNVANVVITIVTSTPTTTVVNSLASDAPLSPAHPPVSTILNEGAWARWTYQGQPYTNRSLPLFWPETSRIWMPMIIKPNNL